MNVGSKELKKDIGKMASKYKTSKQIESLDELCKCEFVFHIDLTGLMKIYNHGWVCEWSLRYSQSLINKGQLFKAELKQKQPTPVEHIEKRDRS